MYCILNSRIDQLIKDRKDLGKTLSGNLINQSIPLHCVLLSYDLSRTRF